MDPRAGIARYVVAGGSIAPLAPALDALPIGIELRGFVAVTTGSLEAAEPLETTLARLADAVAVFSLLTDVERVSRAAEEAVGLMTVEVVAGRVPIDGLEAAAVGLLAAAPT